MKIKVNIIGCILVFSVCQSLLIAQEKTKPLTAIIGAFGPEVQTLENQISEKQSVSIQGLHFSSGKLNGRNVVIAKTGVGKVNAAMTATLLINHFNPNELIFTGISGGLNPELFPGDVVIGQTTVQHDYGRLLAGGFENHSTRNPIDGMRNPIFFPANKRLLKIAEESADKIELEKIKVGTKQHTPKIITGIISTGDCFVASSSGKEEIRKRVKADVVEMEGAAVSQVCFQLKVPCIVIRSVSDVADEEALVDIEKFYQIAAQNSAKLVVKIIEKLNLERTLKEESYQKASD